MNKFPLVDFGIIVALDEEFEGLKEAFGTLKPIERVGTRVFYRKILKSRGREGREYHVIATNLSVMGQTEAGNATRDLLDAWRPQHTILVGIAGGMHKDVNLGDVIVSSDILNYEPRKETVQGTKYRPESLPASRLLLAMITEFCLNTPARERWEKACVKKTGYAPKYHKGLFASGNAVIADTRTKKALQRLSDKIYGVEMEAATAFAAAFNSADPKRIIMVRGVCDHADPNKAKIDAGENWRSTAAFNAARFVREFISFGNIEPLSCDEFHLNTALMIPKIDLNLGSRAGCSYPFFEKLVEPRGPILQMELRVRAFDSAGQALTITRSIWTAVSGERRVPSVQQCFEKELRISISRSKPDFFALHLEIEGELAKVEFHAKTESKVVVRSWTA